MHSQAVALRPAVHLDAAEGGEAQAPRCHAVRWLLGAILRALPVRLAEKIPDRVQEPPSGVWRELGIPRCAVAWGCSESAPLTFPAASVARGFAPTDPRNTRDPLSAESPTRPTA